MKYFNIILESNNFYIQIGTGSFEIVKSEKVLVSGLIHADDKNHLISLEPPTDYDVNIENDWISDNEIYGIFSENDLNFSNSYNTIQKILICEKGSFCILFIGKINIFNNYKISVTTLFISF